MSQTTATNAGASAGANGRAQTGAAAGGTSSTAAMTGASGSSAPGASNTMGGVAGSRGSSQTGMAGGGADLAAAGSGGSTAAMSAAGSAASVSVAGSSGSTPSMSSAGSGGSSGPSMTTNCAFADPPADVADWVQESWDEQLGDNIKNRKAWNLDNVMLNKGELNLCVRWGATMAVPAEVRMNLASTVERWFNDWFKGLGDYGCFPYGEGIKVKVTGWAVRPGRESLLEGIDPSIPVYTEQDGDGEPKCPDSCSSFEHWDHDFSGCAKGADMHSDYWLWFDDMLPGGGGAAAVGGDWGLRMPVSTFIDAFSKPSDHIVEHEMGHGFGFQDYYDWRGAKPKDGSIMIVGSTPSESPTLADSWLLRRTWKEMKMMRGW